MLQRVTNESRLFGWRRAVTKCFAVLCNMLPRVTNESRLFGLQHEVGKGSAVWVQCVTNGSFLAKIAPISKSVIRHALRKTGCVGDLAHTHTSFYHQTNKLIVNGSSGFLQTNRCGRKFDPVKFRGSYTARSRENETQNAVQNAYRNPGNVGLSFPR